MKDIGSANYVRTPQHIAPVHRSERPVEKASVTFARTRVVENHHTTEARGSNQAVRDSDHKLLYTRSAAKVISTADDVSKTVHYTRDAARVTTAVEESSKTLLDIRA